MINNLFDNISLARTIAISVAIVFILFFSVVIYSVYAPAMRGDLNLVEVNVESGDGLRVVAKKLYSLGLIRSELLFVSYVKVGGDEDNLKAGRYLFSKSINIPAIVSSIVSGNSETEDIEITIPEGFNIWEIDQKLVQAGLISEGKFSSKYYQEEGYLFPDTYRIKNQNSKIKIQNSNVKFKIEELRDKMSTNFKNKTAGLLKNLDAEKQKKVIIIASILEKEAKTEEDMRLVAGIIQNRLSMGMLLEIDASVVYGACLRNFEFRIPARPAGGSNFEFKDCDVTFQGPAAEIKIDSPYNTYIRKGLPVGPISNPGLKAIRAVLNPQVSDYLFYLSTRDGSQIIYSKTAGEHAANRRKYLGI